MKKVLIILFLLVCGFGLVGCKDKNPEVPGVVVEDNYIYYKEIPTKDTILFEIDHLFTNNPLIEEDAKTIEFTDEGNVADILVWFQFIVNDKYECKATYERYTEVKDKVRVYRWRLMEIKVLGKIKE